MWDLQSIFISICAQALAMWDLRAPFSTSIYVRISSNKHIVTPYL